MKLANLYSSLAVSLTPEQKERFQAYVPGKVYHTEKNIAIVVAATQLCMILFFVFRGLSLAFLWLRRVYAVLLCLWVVGISFPEQVIQLADDARYQAKSKRRDQIVRRER